MSEERTPSFLEKLQQGLPGPSSATAETPQLSFIEKLAQIRAKALAEPLGCSASNAFAARWVTTRLSVSLPNTSSIFSTFLSAVARRLRAGASPSS